MGKQKMNCTTTNYDKTSSLTREFSIEGIRAIEGEGNERKFILSFSSEEPYERWWGVEILSHDEGAVNLERLNSIGCILFNHNRDKVIGKINKAWIENGRGQAEVEFDTDEESEKIYQKVKSGTLKGVSVGYKIDLLEEVQANKKSSNGKFTGPCDVATKWTPFEISIVSVPADPTVGVGRSLPKHEDVDYSIYERQIQINKNLIYKGVLQNG